MSKIKNSKTLFKSQAQTKIIDGQLKEKKPERENTPIKPASNNTSKVSFFSSVSPIPTENLKKEPLGVYYEERKKILFGEIDVNKEQFYISQFLLNSQKKINTEYLKMLKSGSNFFTDVPQKTHNFTLGVKENIANFCLIIRLYLLYNNAERAYEIFLLMCKQNKKILEFIYNKLYQYCKRSGSTML